MVVAAAWLLRPIRWAMYWESSPTERAVFAKHLEREPLLNLAKAWLTSRKANDDIDETNTDTDKKD